MHATSALRAPSALLRRPFWSVAAPLRGGAPRRSAASPGAPPSAAGRSRAFRCDAAALTSEDDAALEAEAEKPKRLAQQVRARRAPPRAPPRESLPHVPTARAARRRRARATDDSSAGARRVEPLAPPSR